MAAIQAPGWVLAVCKQAGEAGGSFRCALPSRPRGDGADPDPERAGVEAARRARGKVRRYCAANRLNRLGTLTYAGTGCHDPYALRADVSGFFRQLRTSLGGEALAYVWTAEWHKTGHGLHVHFAVGRFVKRCLIESAWGRGFVHIKLLGDLPVGSGAMAEARKAAGYLSKYVGKSFDEARVPGLHRYEVAQGFQPRVEGVWGRTAQEAIVAACVLMDGARPERTWSSSDVAGWQGPPAVWVSWPG